MIRDANEIAHRKIEIDLNGPDGNAYCLLGLANRLIKKLDIEPQDHLEDIDSAMIGLGFEEPDQNEVYSYLPEPHPIIKEMMSSDYEHLIKTFDYYFGHVVDLFR